MAAGGSSTLSLVLLTTASGVCIAMMFVPMFIYFFYRRLRRTWSAIIMLCFSTSVALALTVFILALVPSDPTFCRAWAILLHYFLLASMLWLLATCYHFYSVVVVEFGIDEVFRFRLYSALCWGGAASVVGATVGGTEASAYGNVTDFCWIDEGPALYGGFYAPLGASVAAGCLFLVAVQGSRRWTSSGGIASLTPLNEYRSIALSGLLLFVAWAALGTINILPMVVEYIFAVSIVVYGVLFLVFHGLLSRAINHALCGTDAGEPKSSSSESSGRKRSTRFYPTGRRSQTPAVDASEENVNPLFDPHTTAAHDVQGDSTMPMPYLQVISEDESTLLSWVQDQYFNNPLRPADPSAPSSPVPPSRLSGEFFGGDVIRLLDGHQQGAHADMALSGSKCAGVTPADVFTLLEGLDWVDPDGMQAAFGALLPIISSQSESATQVPKLPASPDIGLPPQPAQTIPSRELAPAPSAQVLTVPTTQLPPSPPSPPEQARPTTIQGLVTLEPALPRAQPPPTQAAISPALSQTYAKFMFPPPASIAPPTHPHAVHEALATPAQLLSSQPSPVRGLISASAPTSTSAPSAIRVDTFDTLSPATIAPIAHETQSTTHPAAAKPQAPSSAPGSAGSQAPRRSPVGPMPAATPIPDQDDVPQRGPSDAPSQIPELSIRDEAIPSATLAAPARALDEQLSDREALTMLMAIIKPLIEEDASVRQPTSPAATPGMPSANAASPRAPFARSLSLARGTSLAPLSPTRIPESAISVGVARQPSIARARSPAGRAAFASPSASLSAPSPRAFITPARRVPPFAGATPNVPMRPKLTKSSSGSRLSEVLYGNTVSEQPFIPTPAMRRDAEAVYGNSRSKANAQLRRAVASDSRLSQAVYGNTIAPRPDLVAEGAAKSPQRPMPDDQVYVNAGDVLSDRAE